MILENIAKAIEKSGKSRTQISKDTGIDNAALCRIMQGGSCKAETVEMIGLYWHFVDIVWVIIFTLVYLIPA